MYGAYGQGGQQQSQYGYNQQQQQQQYGAPAQQQYGYQQQPQMTQQPYSQQPQQTQQQPVANNVNVVQPEQQPAVVESSKPAPIYVDTQHDDMVRFISFSLYHIPTYLKNFCYQLVLSSVFCIWIV